jgi:hypothetical protein
MTARLALVACLLLASASSAAASTRVSGTLTLGAFDPQKSCTFSPARMAALPASLGAAARAIPPGSNVLLAKCNPSSPATKFTGSPATKAAGYGWNWTLAVGKNGKTTGIAVETGTVVLIRTSGPQLTLQLIGVQRPVGAQTSAHAKGFTTGTWTALGTKGSGTYTFSTERKGSTFTTAVLHLSGSVG